ncbi:EAL domain-containing protein [Usitatibacter palustris]|uniref:EAL domain-containing protein n=1 Tax=Usitatibacter palustris TaxID=2732487 RepID=A0A6M4H1V6_9PROT|nr:EAL domain-containing protein [Usitatibacter palustris]QJR13325.1 hypothetical protein DSM104440_00108 [Usitatibacter palustris]
MPASIEFNGLTLVSTFQPIYNVRETRAEGYEGLVRASRADGTPVNSGDLFDSLDESELISLDRTCRTLHLRNFAAVDPGDRMLYLNMHPVAAVADATQAKEVRSRIGYFGLTPERVCIEILEGSCADEGLLVEAADAYRSMGFKLAMDDFGVERSNFDRVAAIGPDLVKIDRSILADAVGNVKARRMLPAVVGLLHEAGSKVVIEGIEDASEALLAIESGADYLQGFYFAPPGVKLHNDALTDRMLAELTRVRRPVIELAPESVNEASSLSAVARLLKSARSLSIAERFTVLKKTGSD